MSAPIKPWETTTLNNNDQILKSSNIPSAIAAAAAGGGHGGVIRAAPPLPQRPLPSLSYQQPTSTYNQSYCSPYSSYGSSYGYGGYNSMPYRSTMYGGYNNYGYGNSYGMYGNYAPQFGVRDDETRFIQYAEDSSRNTFANVENIVRAFNSMAMLLDNTFFAMTSSFRAVLSVAENFGRIRSMFGQIWHAINIFRLFMWAYRRFMALFGVHVPENSKTLAWKEAANGGGGADVAPPGAGSSWPTIAFFGILFSAPYFISKLLPKDKFDADEWKANGISGKAIFDFNGQASNELSFRANDEILLAPRSVQEEMKLAQSGWLYAMHNGRCGIVPTNYVMSSKGMQQQHHQQQQRKATKRVSFGENKVYEATAVVTAKEVVDETLNKSSSSSLSSRKEEDVDNMVESVAQQQNSSSSDQTINRTLLTTTTTTTDDAAEPNKME